MWRVALKAIASKVKMEAAFYRRLHQHPQTPKFAKMLLWAALAYLAMPFDLIPDFIPILGQVDDAIIIPLLIFIALRLTPKAVKEACKVIDQ